MRRQTVLCGFEWVSICVFLNLVDLPAPYEYSPGPTLASLELDIICDGISDDLTTIRSNGEYSKFVYLLYYITQTRGSFGSQHSPATSNSFVPGEVTRSHRHAARALCAARPDVSLLNLCFLTITWTTWIIWTRTRIRITAL